VLFQSAQTVPAQTIYTVPFANGDPLNMNQTPASANSRPGITPA
jgi:hypothetical protein